MTTLTVASWDMDKIYPIGTAFSTTLVGMLGNEGFSVQPFTPVATGLPSRLRIAGGNVSWDMTVNFEIWCDGKQIVKKIVDTNGFDQYSLNGYVYNLSFEDVENRQLIQADKPCELRIQTTKSSISYTAFGVQPKSRSSVVLGKFGTLDLPGYNGEQTGVCLYMDLTVK